MARRAELVADRLGLAGVASVDAFMNADTAELIVLEADAVPSLAPSADLLQQARAYWSCSVCRRASAAPLAWQRRCCSTDHCAAGAAVSKQ